MGSLRVQYPFANNGHFLINGAANLADNDDKIFKYFVGNNNIFSKYGGIFIENRGSANITERALRFTSSFAPYIIFRYYIPGKSTSSVSSLTVYASNTTVDSGQRLYLDDTIGARDYTTIPFYTYETSSTYMFAFDSLNNFFMITERISIDDPTVKSCALIARKTCNATDTNPLGVYEWNDSTIFNYDPTVYSNKYTDSSLYNASNIGYCSTCVLFQYVRDGFVYPDIYYCDGGMSVPPDGLVRIGASNFMRLGSNLFLRVD